MPDGGTLSVRTRPLPNGVEGLAATGYETSMAPSRRAAIEKAQASRFDLIVMDVQMPGLNGVQTLHALRALDPHVSVIMMTAYTRDELVVESGRAMADEEHDSVMCAICKRPIPPGSGRYRTKEGDVHEECYREREGREKSPGARGSGAHNPRPEAEHRSRLRAFTFYAQQNPDRHALHGDVQVLASRLQISRWGHQAVIRDAAWLRWIAEKSNPFPTFPGYSHIHSRRILKNQPLQERVWRVCGPKELAHDLSGEVNREGQIVRFR